VVDPSNFDSKQLSRGAVTQSSFEESAALQAPALGVNGGMRMIEQTGDDEFARIQSEYQAILENLQPAKDQDDLAVRIQTEREAILRHLGPDAPNMLTEIEPEVNRDKLIRFVAPADVYSLAGDFAVRFRRLVDGTEDVAYWRDGQQIRRFITATSEEVDNHHTA
jgi:hypothetical protein